MAPPDTDAPDTPDASRVREEVLDAVVGFARDLRRTGVVVPANASIVATAALAEVGWSEKATVRAAMQATLLTRKEDREQFDRLFETFWTELRGAGCDPPAVHEDMADAARSPGSELPEPDGAEDVADDDRRDDAENEVETADSSSLGAATAEPADEHASTVETARYSPVGDSDPVSPALALQRHSLADPVERLTRGLATLPGRRRRRTTSGRFVDARRALRASFQTGGVVASIPESERADSDVRGAVFVDVSQSVLDSIDREFLLEWLRVLVDRWRSVRVFFFDTDVREVTEAFDERSIGDVSDALARAEARWGGGTRIGHALQTVRTSSPEAVDRRTVVLVISDGLERGDVDDLESSAAWLSRRARLFLWLNPLATSPEYEPTARGMAAALPAVDGLFAFAGPADVTELARQLERNDRRRLGYEYDPRRSGGRIAGGAARNSPTDTAPTPND